MKKIVFFLALICVLVILSASSALAYEYDDAQAEALGIKDLQKSVPDSAEKMLDGPEIGSFGDIKRAVEKLKDNFLENAGQVLRESLKGPVSLVAASLFISLAAMLCPEGNKKYESYVSMAGVIAVITVGTSGVGAGIRLGRETIDEIYSFSKALLPTLTAAAAAGGAITSAAAKYAVATLFMDIQITVCNDLVFPLIYGYIVTASMGAAFENDGVTAAAKLLKWIISSLMTIIVLVFIVYLAVTGTVLGTSDDAAARVAKTAISTSLPIIGSIISDAASSVVGGINTLKSIVGVFGLVVVVAVCAIPFLKLSAGIAMNKAAGAMAAAVSDKKVSEAINVLGNAYAMVLGLCGSCAIMFFASVISALKTVTGA